MAAGNGINRMHATFFQGNMKESEKSCKHTTAEYGIVPIIVIFSFGTSPIVFPFRLSLYIP
jgi:hypothetical protein